MTNFLPEELSSIARLSALVVGSVVELIVASSRTAGIMYNRDGRKWDGRDDKGAPSFKRVWPEQWCVPLRPRALLTRFPLSLLERFCVTCCQLLLPHTAH